MVFDVRFKQGSTVLICGPTSSGKTSLVSQIITHKKVLFDNAPDQVFLFYTQPQKIYEDLMKNGVIKKMFNGYPTYDNVRKIVLPYKNSGGSIIILDDQLSGLSEDIMRIFHELCHHCNSTCFFLSQNLFHADKKFRSISLNSNYMIIMKNVRDKSQIIQLAKQWSPLRINYIIQSYIEATKKMYGYLLFDNHQKTPDMIRIRTNILPQEKPVTIFIEKS